METRKKRTIRCSAKKKLQTIKPWRTKGDKSSKKEKRMVTIVAAKVFVNKKNNQGSIMVPAKWKGNHGILIRPIYLIMLAIVAAMFVLPMAEAKVVYSVPQQSGGDIGIETVKIAFVESGHNANIYIHVFNDSYVDTTGGELLTNTTIGCLLDIYNSTSPYQAITEVNLTLMSNYRDWNYTLPGKLIQTPGEYHYIISCYCPGAAKCGGWTSDTFTVTATGGDGSQSDNLFLLVALVALVLIVLAMWAHNSYLAFVSGLILTAGGVYIMIYGVGGMLNIYTQAISYILIGVGAYFIISMAYDAIGDNFSLYEKEDDGD